METVQPAEVELYYVWLSFSLKCMHWLHLVELVLMDSIIKPKYQFGHCSWAKATVQWSPVPIGLVLFNHSQAHPSGSSYSLPFVRLSACVRIYARVDENECRNSASLTAWACVHQHVLQTSHSSKRILGLDREPDGRTAEPSDLVYPSPQTPALTPLPLVPL